MEIERLKSAIAKQKYFTHTKENLLKVYDSIGTNQIFGAVAHYPGFKRAGVKFLKKAID